MLFFIIFVGVCLCVYIVRSLLKTDINEGKLAGPTGYPIIGNALMFLNKGLEDHLPVIDEIVRQYGTRIKVYLPNLIYCLTDAEDVEVVLTQSEFNSKSIEYYYLKPWLGLGLLTSTGEQWRKHRKVITPAFHFKILENYLQTIDKQTDTLIEKLKNKSNGEIVNVFHDITLCALDIICETSMGTSINAQMNSESEYVKAVQGISELMTTRMKHCWKQSDFLFQFSDDYKRHQKYLKILHNFTNTVIQQRKTVINNNKEVLETYMDTTNIYGQKRKIAFLDLLLLSKIDGEPLSDLDIREEVDTFLFEGHDTISSAIGFALHELSKLPDIQQKIYEEQKQVFAKDENQPLTYSVLQEMKYLEMVIKESLRLFPSVPLLGRTVSRDTKIRDLFVPKDTSIVIYAMAIHKNPKYFPEPEKFIPERFTPEESNKRNPFSIISFSAGPRNCIGQKFAMLELKTTLSKIVRNFIIEPSGIAPVLLGSLVLKPMNGISIRLRKRTN